jgi:hypothetical protein
MTTGPIALEPIIERLESQLQDWKQFGGAADLESAQKGKAQITPAGFVLLANDQPRPPEGSTQRVIQRVITQFGVLIAVRDYKRADRGAGQAEELRQRVREVRSTLIGWRHPDCNTSTRLGGRCRLLGFREGVLWWQDIYSAEYHVRN